METARNTVKVWAAVTINGNEENITIFDSYDEIDVLHDFACEYEISESTYKKLASGDYFARKYGNTLRAYTN